MKISKNRERRKKALEQLLVQAKKPNDYDLRDYQETLFRAVDGLDLVDKDFVDALMENQITSPEVLYQIPYRLSSLTTQEQLVALKRLIRHPRVDSDMVKLAADRVPTDTSSQEESFKFILEAVESKIADGAALKHIVKHYNWRQPQQKSELIRRVVSVAEKDPERFTKGDQDPIGAAISVIKDSDLKASEIENIFERAAKIPGKETTEMLIKQLPAWDLDREKKKKTLNEPPITVTRATEAR